MGLSSLDYWKLSDELSIIDAAILITGNDPSEKLDVRTGYDDDPIWVQNTGHDGFDAVFKALKNAVLSNKLAVNASFKLGNDEQRSYSYKFYAVLKGGEKVFMQRELNYYSHDALVFLETDPDWERTIVEVDTLKSWLQTRQMYPPFFFPNGNPDGIMNQDGARYSAKLACAVAAWENVRVAARNKTPKQTIEAWVAANGTKFGLENEEGTVPTTALSEISKVTNWQPQGGAAKSGGGFEEPTNGYEVTKPDHHEELEVESDESGYGVKINDVPF